MVTREVNNSAVALVNLAGKPLANVDIVFTLVDIKGVPTDAFDAVTHERITGIVRVRTDSAGYFSVRLWPTTRADHPVYYHVHVNYTSYVDFIAGLQEGSTPVDFAELKTFGTTTKPLQEMLLQKTLDDMKDIMSGNSTGRTAVGPAPITAYQVVALNPAGSLVIADHMDIAHFGKVIGIAVESGMPGDKIAVCRMGTALNMAWSLNTGSNYYLSTLGTMTDVVPTTGFLQCLGLSASPQALFVSVATPILL